MTAIEGTEAGRTVSHLQPEVIFWKWHRYLEEGREGDQGKFLEEATKLELTGEDTFSGKGLCVWSFINDVIYKHYEKTLRRDIFLGVKFYLFFIFLKTNLS